MSDAPSLAFHSASEGEEAMYDRARRVGYAGFPNIDISREQARRVRRHEEDGILAGRRLRLSSDTGRARSPAGPQRRSDKNRKANKGKGRAGVYGQWGEHTGSRPAPVVAEVDDAPFDGENENPGAWQADSEGVSLRWTRKARPPPVITEPEPQPQIDEVPTAASPETVIARSDAVDLVSESQIEIPEARHHRSSSAAPALPPQVTLIQSPHEEEPPVPSLTATLEPPKAVPPRQTASAPPVVEREPSPVPGSPPRSLEADVSPPDAWERPEPVFEPVPVRAPTPQPAALKSAPALVQDSAPTAPPSEPQSASTTQSSFRVPSYARWEPDDNPWA